MLRLTARGLWRCSCWGGLPACSCRASVLRSGFPKQAKSSCREAARQRVAATAKRDAVATKHFDSAALCLGNYPGAAARRSKASRPALAPPRLAPRGAPCCCVPLFTGTPGVPGSHRKDTSFDLSSSTHPSLPPPGPPLRPCCKHIVATRSTTVKSRAPSETRAATASALAPPSPQYIARCLASE